ncbi:MAG: glycosyltransferase family 39 protein [Solirubrobacteraceae bacterium]
MAFIAAAPILAYVWVALHRVGYAFELDWMEGGSVELAARVAGGHSLYAAPSLHFVGWTYTPLYYWISAALGQITGVGFLPLRLVSLAASLISMATLAWVVTRETGEWLAGLVSAGLFAASFRISGAWFDTGRVDSLFLALSLVTLAWGARARGVRGGLGLGLLVFLAFFTKQIAVVALLPVIGYLLLVRPRVAITAVLTLLGLLVASTLALDGLTDGWYRYYVFDELAHQPWAKQVWIQFWSNDVIGHQWPLLLVLFVAGAVRVRAGSVASLSGVRRGALTTALGWREVYWMAGAAGLIGAAWISRLHTGGYANVLMPAYAAFALLAGLAGSRLWRGSRRRLTAVLLCAALVLQVGLLRYPLSAQIPTTAQEAAGLPLISALRELPANVLVLRHPWYATEAGKGSFAQAEAISDVLRSGSPRGRQVLQDALGDALNADHIEAVVLDGGFDAHFFRTQLARDFRLVGRPITRARLYPLTDVRTAPTLLYVRIHPGEFAR